MLCLCVALAALGLQTVEDHVFGRPWIEALVLAILIGTAVRTAWTPGAAWLPGIAFSAKMLLEVAVFLLGATISVQALASAGVSLIVGIAVVVLVAIAASYGLCRALRLPSRMALLIACGNSICGNSAIAAVAPVIGATSEDVVSSIAFTAILGVVVVLLLPALIPVLHLSVSQYGILAGLTVYAVPQVLAATVPVATVSVQIGTLVKLVRVLMLGPVVLGLSAFGPKPEGASARDGVRRSVPIKRLVPWFIIGFLMLTGLRSAGAIPNALLAPIATLTTGLTVIAMAALGLGVDLKILRRVGGRVTTAVTLSLAVLFAISLSLIVMLHVI